MNPLRIKLAHKIVLLLVASLAVQFILFNQLMQLHAETENVFNRAIKEKEISETINRIEIDLADTSRLMHGRQLELSSFDIPSFQFLIESTRQHLANLKELTADDPDFSNVVAQSQKAYEEFTSVLEEARANKNDEGSHPLSAKAIQLMHTVVSEQLMTAGKKAKRFVDASKDKQAALRDQQKKFLAMYLFAIVALTVFTTWVIVSKLSKRISLVSENVARYSTDQPLEVVPQSDDEVGALEKAFQTMINQLDEAKARERAIVENTRDLICSIDPGGNIVETNQRSMELLQYSPDELIGQPFNDLIEMSAIKKTLEWLDAVRYQGGGSFDTRMISNDGRCIDTLWTAYWSAQDQLTYCVIHDNSARRKLDRIKQDVALMSTHDLKSPLTVIDNYFEMLQFGQFGSISNEAKEPLKLAAENVQRLIVLIKDFLDLEKIDSGLMQVKMTRFSLMELLQRCLEALSQNNLSFEIGGVDKAIEVHADGTLCEAVLTRIIQLSSERVCNEAPISVSARVNGDVRILVELSDSDISDDELRSLFERVNRSDEESQASLLGFFVCRSFLRLIDGDASVSRNSSGNVVFELVLQKGRDEE